jgi:hypothetical protein
MSKTITGSLVSNLCAFDPVGAMQEVAARDGLASGWTAIVEAKTRASESRDPPEAARALRAFEDRCFAAAVRSGVLSSPDGTSPRSELNARESDVDLPSLNLPPFDSQCLELNPASQLSSAAAVLLLHGRRSGFAVIIPPNAPLSDCVCVALPRYTSQIADRLLMDRADGWIPALLSWRERHELAPFDSAIRRTSVRLWDTALGTVADQLDQLGGVRDVDLVVFDEQRMLPWSCAASTQEMRACASERWRLSTGGALATLKLGRDRMTHGSVSVNERRARFDLLLMMNGPFLSQTEAITARLLSPSSTPNVVSLVDGMADLPMTRFEADAIRERFGQGAIVHEGSFEPDFASHLFQLMGSADVVHLATHGQWAPTNPWVSAVMLGPRLPLFAASVRARLQLEDSLVLLSACESGIGGPSGAGEGGLVEAFLLAGASTVVASSWMVNDFSSLVFVDAFLREFSRSGDAFASVSHARASTRDISFDAVSVLAEGWARRRPEFAATLQRNVDDASLLGDSPFSSPVHWGAPFIATTHR